MKELIEELKELREKSLGRAERFKKALPVELLKDISFKEVSILEREEDFNGSIYGRIVFNGETIQVKGFPDDEDLVLGVFARDEREYTLVLFRHPRTGIEWVTRDEYRQKKRILEILYDLYIEDYDDDVI